MPRAVPPGSLALPGLEDAGLSPIRRQYLDLKRKHPDAILFFRLGDFYETFEDDAETVARVLDIALTSREMGRGVRLPLAGIPVHAIDGYVARLIGQGYHVAVAEQIGEVPRSGLVRREIVRVLTPGTVLEDDLLAGSRNNYLAALLPDGRAFGLAYLDISTGDFLATEVGGPTARENLAAELTRIGAAECLTVGTTEGLADLLPPGTHVTERGAELFSAAATARHLSRAFGGTPEATGLSDSPLALRAAGALLAYVSEARPSATRTLRPPRPYSLAGSMVLDRATRRNLDLLETSGGSGLTLLAVLDRTVTAMGARLLRAMVGQPLVDPDRINQRLEAVETLAGDATLRTRLGEALRNLPDLERLAVRAGQELLSPRECRALASGLEQVATVQGSLGAGPLGGLLDRARAALDRVPEAVADVRATIREDANTFEEGVIREGVSADLDEQRSLSGDARRWIVDLEQRERERTGVRSVKVGYNRVFGYYLEVPTAQCQQTTDYYQRQATGADTVLQHLERLGWDRKQTLARAERFVTADLREMEARVARAQEEAVRLERELYATLLTRLAGLSDRMARTARALAQLDALLSLAETACANGYVRPTVDDGDTLRIEGGRHPVVERSLPAGRFVPNDADLGPAARVMLLTGPNMAGKSTYLRQVALIVLLAQVGSFVPADAAHVGVVDRIFTRIGAQDDIAAGRSTFMVEMTEAAAILRTATDRSLVVLDEIGRGTSTFDGMAIARSIVEDLHDASRPGGSPKTIFATHYHELTALAETLERLRTYRVEVLERGDDVVFLHSVVPGGADRSYGVHVARLAGVPERVTRRARELLRDLEQGRGAPTGDGGGPDRCACCDDLRSIDLLALTPIEAQAELARLRRRAGGEE